MTLSRGECFMVGFATGFLFAIIMFGIIAYQHSAQ